MKIAFCSPYDFRAEFGKTKIMLGLGKGLQKIGWHCDYIDGETTRKIGGSDDYAEAFQRHIRKLDSEYDFIEYEHDQCRLPEIAFKNSLWIARVSLLSFHYETLRLPKFNSAREWISELMGVSVLSKKRVNMICRVAWETCMRSDLINVANPDDAAVLEKKGIAPEKVTVIPYGLSGDRLASLGRNQPDEGSLPVIAWIGTFDQRKGGVDLSEILDEISAVHPQIRMKLLGTGGVFQTKDEVLGKIPTRHHPRLEIIPHYPEEELRAHLSHCTIGMFPSYLESFGFGVLEMMASGIPVVAYRCPGPPVMLPEDLLVDVGDRKGMAQKINRLISDSLERKHWSEWCRARAQNFCWEEISKGTAQIYAKHLSNMRNKA